MIITYLQWINMYTQERNIQIVISLLKAHGIKKIIASPGSMNMTFVASVQADSYFEVYSCVDERSAAYIACGMSEESGEPIVLSCTGATASRDYMPGLTEAYYRKLPILAVTSLSDRENVGQLISQQVDRSQLPKDIAIESVYLPIIKDWKDEVVCEREANKAMLALYHNGGGPVHVDLCSSLAPVDLQDIKPARVIKRYTRLDVLPEIPKGKICVMMGVHKVMKHEIIHAIDNFCATNNGIVVCVNPKNYTGKFAVNAGLLFSQINYVGPLNEFDLCIHIGEVNTDTIGFKILPNTVWRVSEDGCVRDVYNSLTSIFQMTELEFFNHYSKCDITNDSLLREFNDADNELRAKIPELPFGTAWIAQTIAPRIPQESDVHLGILNSLRAWDYANPHSSIRTYANTGGFGIDGCLSSMVGASITSPDKQFYGMFGDLAFFYDMNVLGNRHVGNNLHILLINDDGGQQFRNSDHPASVFDVKAQSFISATGHNGPQSKNLVQHFVTDLGFRYMAAKTKEEFIDCIDSFIKEGESVILEVLVGKESDGLRMLRSIIPPKQPNKSMSKTIKTAVKKAVGKDKIEAFRTLLGL